MMSAAAPEKLRESLSVVIPTYKEARRLPATLRAVLDYLGKRFESFEVIVVDDNSPDGTGDIVREYAARMPQVARDVIKSRAAQLREKGAERLALRLDRHVGQTVMALVEAGNRARLPDFAPVRIDARIGGPSPEPGRPALIHLASRTATDLVGQPA